MQSQSLKAVGEIEMILIYIYPCMHAFSYIQRVQSFVYTKA